MSVKTGQRLIRERFKKPAKVVIHDFYYGQELTVKVIAEACDVTPSCIFNWMREWGWPRRSWRAQIVIPPKPTEDEEDA